MGHAADLGRVEQKPLTVALVSMPFHRCLMPPIGLGILKSALAASGLPSTVYSFNLDLLPELGDTAERAIEHYEWIGNNTYTTLAGEWLFSPPDPAMDERYLATLSDCGFGPERIALLRHLRSRRDDLVSRWAHRLVAAGHDVVGFSSSYARTRATVCLAEAIRRLAPGTKILVGGSGVAGDMGRAVLEAFPIIDLVCHAEADELIVPIVRALRGEPGYSLEALRGISYRQGSRLLAQMEEAPPPDLERTPRPDYDDYFEQVDALRSTWDRDLDLPSYIPVETARGCWWGARQHCVFCSMNGDRMAFRSKSAERVMSDLDALSSRHGAKRFFVVDNVLDPAYFSTLLPLLGARREGRLFYWEVRPTLRRQQVATLARGGVVHVLPGIESLSTPALQVMRKGTTAIDNLQTLKWLMAYEVQCTWYFLFSLPGERLEWYEEVARAVPRLMHLQPPVGPLRVAMQRFSPYFSNADLLGVKLAGPSRFARLAFGDVDQVLLERFAYGFDYEIEDRPPDLDARIIATLQPLLAKWRDRFETRGCTLSLVDGPDEMLVVEGPLLAPDRIFRVRGLLRRFLKGSESIQPERVLLARLAGDGEAVEDVEPSLGPRAYRRLLEELCSTDIRPEEGPQVTLSNVADVADARGWVYRETGRILSLPVDRARYVESGPFQLEAALRRCQAT